jgi:outer membrane receptor protein involved in Fe transport
VHLFAEFEFGSGQYDDVLEERRLDSWWTARLGGRLEVTDALTMQVRVENLFDEKIDTGLSNSGLRSTGLPRSLWFNVSCRY